MPEGQVSILLVDDDAVCLKVLGLIVARDGYRILTAADGGSALRVAAEQQPGLILLDVLMPGLDGIETCRRLKAQPETRHIPVVFMTSLSEPTDKVKGFEAGAVDYLTKPPEAGEVLARVRAHLGIHRLRREVDAYGALLLEIAGQRAVDGLLGAVQQFFAASPGVSFAGLWLAEENGAGPARLEPVAADPPPALAGMLARRAQSAGAQLASAEEEPPAGTAARPGIGPLPPHIASPILHRGKLGGVLVVFFRAPVRDAFPDHCKWHRILADSVGAALANARAFAEIESLQRRLEQQNEYLREEVAENGAFSEIVGSSPAMQKVFDEIVAVAPTDAPVLLLGESGTGKELFARAIHERSRRRDMPLIKVNCAAIPRELFESEFFGHTKGAFTGAQRDRAGRFELADRGTLFLDEVSEIPPDLQGKLLRVLQEGSYERIGDEATRHTNVRIVAASNRDLQADIRSGRFRQDLYFRLSVIPIHVPPLSQRMEDIPALARHFLRGICLNLGVPAPELRPEHLQLLQGYAWPGNVRELRNELERAVILSRGGPLRFHMPQAAAPAAAPAPAQPAPAATPEAPAGRPEEGRVLTESEWEERGRRNLQRALEQTCGRIEGAGGAAELLGIKATTLRSRLKVLGLLPGGRMPAAGKQ